MGDRRSAALREALVARLERTGAISTPGVRDAFLEVPRELFLPGLPLRAVYRDEAIVTRHDPRGAATSSSSQPAIMAHMLEALAVEPGARVLEVGAGTGYNAALLATIVGPHGHVVSVELDPETAAEARSALAEGGYRAEVVLGDGRGGWPAGAPYDRIVVTASASEVAQRWHEQLRERGLLVVPLRIGDGAIQAIPALRKEEAGFRSVAMLVGGFMPLRGSPAEEVEHEPRLEAPSSSPRLRGLGMRVPRSPLALYLALEAPAGRFVHGPAGIGVVGPDGESVALVTGGRDLDRIAAWGGPAAEELLVRLLGEWHGRGEPTEAQLELSVSFEGGRSALRHRWRAHTDSQPRFMPFSDQGVPECGA